MIRTIALSLGTAAAALGISFAGTTLAGAEPAHTGWPSSDRTHCTALFGRISDVHDRISRADGSELQRLLREADRLSDRARFQGCG